MHHDAIIVGGGFAGLSAATYLARARRSVCVIDTGKPRNRFASASHGFLSRDGSDPGAILAAAREQLRAYPTLSLMDGEVGAACAEEDAFTVTLANGDELSARKLILAFGLRDELPAIPGLRERWGQSVLHCPYCHGIEFSDRELGVLYASPMSVHQALLIREWGPTTLYLNGAVLDAESEHRLSERGVAIEPESISQLEGNDLDLASVRFVDGRGRAVAALYVAPQSCFTSPIAEQLGCAIDEGPLGPIIQTDGDRMTSVAGVYAAGDIARAPHTISWAVGDGVTAGTSAHRALVFG